MPHRFRWPTFIQSCIHTFIHRRHLCYKDQRNQHMCIYTVIRQTYEKTEKIFTFRRLLWDLWLKKLSVSTSVCCVTWHCVYTLHTCLGHPPDGRGPNKVSNSIKTRNEKRFKLKNTEEKDFLLTDYFYIKIYFPIFEEERVIQHLSATFSVSYILASRGDSHFKTSGNYRIK